MCLVLIKSFVSSLIIATALFSAPLQANIQQVSSLKVLEDQIKRLESDTLVIFDVDEVLFTDHDAILKPIGDPLKIQIFNEHYAKARSEREREKITHVLSLPLTMAKKELVESSIPAIIQQLQKRSIKVIALTSCPTKPFGIIKNFEAWRLNHLEEFGIDFSGSFPHLDRLALEKLSSNYSSSPVYYRGVLFAEGFSKADVLQAFLNAAHFKPKKVIFIDDMYCHLQQMEIKLKRLGIPYQGYYYVKVQKDSANDLNEEVARFQFDYLFEHQQWLSDQEAAMQLKATN